MCRADTDVVHIGTHCGMIVAVYLEGVELVRVAPHEHDKRERVAGRPTTWSFDEETRELILWPHTAAIDRVDMDWAEDNPHPWLRSYVDARAHALATRAAAR